MTQPLDNLEIRAQVHAMLIMAHALGTELDRIAALIADRSGLEPDSDLITEAVFNSTNAAEALMVLMGTLHISAPN